MRIRNQAALLNLIKAHAEFSYGVSDAHCLIVAAALPFFAMLCFSTPPKTGLLLVLSLLLATSSTCAAGRRTRLQERRERLLSLDGFPLGGRTWALSEGELAGRISGIRPAAQIFRWGCACRPAQVPRDGVGEVPCLCAGLSLAALPGQPVAVTGTGAYRRFRPSRSPVRGIRPGLSRRQAVAATGLAAGLASGVLFSIAVVQTGPHKAFGIHAAVNLTASHLTASTPSTPSCYKHHYPHMLVGPCAS